MSTVAEFETRVASWPHSTDDDGGGGGLIARTLYAPDPQVVYSTQSDVFVDVDAVNLAVPFVVPASGNVSVVLEAVCDVDNVSAAVEWALREGTVTLPGTPRAGTRLSGTLMRVRTAVAVDGLTPGDSKTLKWAHRININTATARLVAGPSIVGPADPVTVSWGPAVMEVWSV